MLKKKTSLHTKENILIVEQRWIKMLIYEVPCNILGVICAAYFLQFGEIAPVAFDQFQRAGRGKLRQFIAFWTWTACKLPVTGIKVACWHCEEKKATEIPASTHLVHWREYFSNPKYAKNTLEWSIIVNLRYPLPSLTQNTDLAVPSQRW